MRSQELLDAALRREICAGKAKQLGKQAAVLKSAHERLLQQQADIERDVSAVLG